MSVFQQIAGGLGYAAGCIVSTAEVLSNAGKVAGFTLWDCLVNGAVTSKEGGQTMHTLYLTHRRLDSVKDAINRIDSFILQVSNRAIDEQQKTTITNSLTRVRSQLYKALVDIEGQKNRTMHYFLSFNNAPMNSTTYLVTTRMGSENGKVVSAVGVEYPF